MPLHLELIADEEGYRQIVRHAIPLRSDAIQLRVEINAGAVSATRFIQFLANARSARTQITQAAQTQGIVDYVQALYAARGIAGDPSTEYTAMINALNALGAWFQNSLTITDIGSDFNVTTWAEEVKTFTLTGATLVTVNALIDTFTASIA